MSRARGRLLWIAALGSAFVIVLGAFLVQRRGWPWAEAQWSIGIYRGPDPFQWDGLQWWINPVLSAQDVTDVAAEFVADPFLIKAGETWYLFFEVLNKSTGQGDVAVATSSNTWTWDYQRVVLDEPFHLSYPHVFQWQDAYYMIPETSDTESIRLYRADDFPVHWSFVTTLIQGRPYVDSSIVFAEGKWWLFSSLKGNATLYLFYADALEGPWLRHPRSPITRGNAHISRPGGRILAYQDKLYRFAQDGLPSYGRLVRAFEITELTPTTYREKLAQEKPIVEASGRGWNGSGMHQFDAVQVGPQSWIAAVDGRGNYWDIFGLR